ncbi:acetamidase/formamidase family protein [Leptolyngbya sp. FACHB-261]|uniref:acetamidase/formamidase family protein n=1 Tax=Leptolyngbya sp. FACHB-261 TaxID=2692806 RepID=UPI00168373A8|nr:acetamidase/formamidase family protein [Leptolyngbya sp. FACHB-261]MBD2100161.1 acetamidase/formamidase family protein [Leptolyngbya sp. FACHB-261]
MKRIRSLRLPKWVGLALILLGITFSTGAFAYQHNKQAQAAITQETLRIAPANYPGKVHLLPATLETTQWGWFDNAQAPVMRIASGDTVVLETMMHSHNQIVPGKTIEELKKLRTDNPGRGPHTVTGPIYVEGAEPGDVLKVKILKIEPRSYAANFNIPGMFGQFPNRFPDGQVKYLYLDMDKKIAQFAPGIEIPLAPFPGTLAVARAEPGRYSSVPPGPYAGNLDIRDFVPGSTLYVPVFVKGALLWTGDSHAAQGNGEVNLTALETAFKEMVLNVEVIKGKPQDWPKIETTAHWITVGVDRDLNKALDNVKAETAKFLAEQRQITPTAAAELMPQVSDCRISQVVNINKGIHCLNPKDIRARKSTTYPVVSNADYYVTSDTGTDLNKVMDNASLAMLSLLQDKEKVSRLDAYALASMRMDCRVNKMSPEAKSVHCLMPKSIWVANRK